MGPAPCTKEELAEVLRDAADRVEAGDSWEGFINWMIPDVTASEPVDCYAMLDARYRIGNADGSQGGMRVFGP